MEQLGEEISTAFQRCCVPESQVTENERRKNETMMTCVVKTDSLLMKGDEALRKRFREKTITATNLQALFLRFPDSNSGAFQAMHSLCQQALDSMTCVGRCNFQIQKKSRGESSSPSSSSSLSKKQIATIDKTMLLYPSEGSPWLGLSHALKRSCQMETPIDHLEVLSNLDWPKILQGENVLVKDIFKWLHRCGCQVLHNDRDNMKAKTFLREQLGSCHELFRAALRRIITGEIYTPDPTSRGLG